MLEINHPEEAIRDPSSFKDLIWSHLKPREGPAPRAHLMTINGLTYPIHRQHGFASVPDPHEIVRRRGRDSLKLYGPRSKRRYSMLSYLHSMRQGDLVFFFQSDPQWPRDLLNRRGFRGIWKVASPPYRGSANVHLPSGYEILSTCPHCGTPFNFGEGKLSNGKHCPLCGEPYGVVSVDSPHGGKRFSRVVLSARILIEPVVIFSSTSGDNRVYGDMSVEPMIWISRTDNAMGLGKGSSIRTLLPEEAAKISYMLASEDRQTIDGEMRQSNCPDTTRPPITDHNGVEARFPRVTHERDGWKLFHEFHLNFFLSNNIDNPQHQLMQCLEIPLDAIDFWTTELPWGYTGDTSDFVMSCWHQDRGRHKIYLFEFKRDLVDKSALVETLLYVPWVVQCLTQFRHETTAVEVIPVIVGRNNTLTRLPSDYGFTTKYFTNQNSKEVIVRSPLILEYNPIDIFEREDTQTQDQVSYASDLEFRRIDLPQRAITPPPLSYTTASVEQEWVASHYFEQL